MKLDLTYDIAVPAEDAWEVFGNQFSRISDWASGIYVSKDPTNGSAGRTCQIPSGQINEIIKEFDTERRSVTYEASGPGFPFMVKTARNTWTFTPTGPKATRVTVHSDLKMLWPFSWLMPPIMRGQFKKILGQAAHELEHYVSKGEVHPEKRKFDAKPKTIKAKQALA